MLRKITGNFFPSENMWLECTSKNLPAGIIDQDEENRKVLLLTPQGGQIETTPSSPASANRIVTSDTILLSDQLLMKGHSHYHGNTEGILRFMHFNTAPEELKKIFLESSKLSVRKIERFQSYFLFVSWIQSKFVSSIHYQYCLVVIILYHKRGDNVATCYYLLVAIHPHLKGEWGILATFS